MVLWRSAPMRPRGLSFDRGYLSVQAASPGLGVALESLVFANRELQAGTLQALFHDPGAAQQEEAYYLVYPSVYADLPKVRAFKAWVTALCFG